MGKCLGLALVTAALLVAVSVGYAQTPSVIAAGLADSLVQDITAAQSLLATDASPWQDARSRPQAEPIRALSAELPGHGLWLALKPLDADLREAYRQQRKMYVDKDPGILDRRQARVDLAGFGEALQRERMNYRQTIISRARRQMLQIDDALEHNEYYAAECILWTMAEGLGLLDGQAALEVAADHVVTMRTVGLRRSKLPHAVATDYGKQLACIRDVIQAAVSGLAPLNLLATGSVVATNCIGHAGNKHWAKEAFEAGGAFAVWRDDQGQSGATSWVFNRRLYRLALQLPARNTKDIIPCLTRPRDWACVLHDYRYGWTVYTRSASGEHWHPHGDWRDMEPNAFWPGGRGSQTAGGL